jgi:hypothetical protein
MIKAMKKVKTIFWALAFVAAFVAMFWRLAFVFLAIFCAGMFYWRYNAYSETI